MKKKEKKYVSTIIRILEFKLIKQLIIILFIIYVLVNLVFEESLKNKTLTEQERTRENVKHINIGTKTSSRTTNCQSEM